MTDTPTRGTREHAVRRRPSRRPTGGTDVAASSIMSFLGAGAVFLIAMAFTISYVSTQGATAPPLSDRLQQSGDEALALTVEGTGFTEDGATAWHDDPDAMARFGLAVEGKPNILDFEKIQELRDGEMETKHNDAPDYPEVREGLGLNDTTNFHLRTVPMFQPMKDDDWTENPTIEGAYVAASTDDSRRWGTSNGTSNTTDDVSRTLSVTVENNDTHDDVVYRVSWEVETDDGTIVDDNQYTPPLDVGEEHEVEFTLYEVDEWSGDVANVTATVYGLYNNEAFDENWVDVDLPADDDSSSDTEHNLEVSPGDHSFGPDQDIKLYLDHYDHAGDRINDQGDGPDARLAIEDPDGTEVVNTTLTLPKNKAKEWTCGDDCTTNGTYTAKLMTTDAARVTTDRFHNASTDLTDSAGSPTDQAQYEMGLLDDLLANFENHTHETDTHDGDVYLDDRSVLGDQLVDHLSSYDVLVIGSNVAHNELTAGGVKWPIHDWVNDEGGHLIVLGNDDPHTQWLKPLHGSGSTTASGGVSTPDPTHPVLHSPEELRYDSYDDHDTAWTLTGNSDEYYTHVLQKDSSENQVEDTLAVSSPGAFDNGSVVLASYQLDNITDPQDREEALQFLRNMVLQSYHMAFIDFGPEVPNTATVSSSKRAAAVIHDSLPGVQVEVKVLMYTWN